MINKVTTSYSTSIFIFYTIITFACSSPSKKEQSSDELDNGYLEMSLKSFEDIYPADDNVDLTLVESSEIKFKIDSNSWNFTFYPSYLDLDTTHYLIAYNRLLNSLDLYDIDRQSFYKRIQFDKTDPDGVSRIYGYHVVNLDSIFIYDNNKNTLFLFDSDRNEKYRVEFPQSVFQKIRCSGRQNMYKVDDYIYFSYSPLVVDNRTYKGKPSQIRFNLITQEIEEVGVPYPTGVTEVQLKHGTDAMYSKGYKNRSVMRFQLLPAVFEINEKSGSVNSYVLRSEIHDRIFPEAYFMENENQEFLPMYYNLLYDQYNMVYYSPFLGARDDEDFDIYGNRNRFDDKPMSFIIADSSFNYRGEITLPNFKYFRSFLVTKDGLLVSNAHPKNPENKEDYMSFTLFKLGTLN